MNLNRVICFHFNGRANSGLRKKIREAAASGGPQAVRGLRHSVALTGMGVASLESVAIEIEANNRRYAQQ
jgi:hypothetical protein